MSAEHLLSPMSHGIGFNVSAINKHIKNENKWSEAYVFYDFILLFSHLTSDVLILEGGVHEKWAERFVTRFQSPLSPNFCPAAESARSTTGHSDLCTSKQQSVFFMFVREVQCCDKSYFQKVPSKYEKLERKIWTPSALSLPTEGQEAVQTSLFKDICCVFCVLRECWI